MDELSDQERWHSKSDVIKPFIKLDNLVTIP